MIADCEEKIVEYFKEYRKTTPALIMRKFQVSAEFANKICYSIWLTQHLEARKLAKEINGG